MHGVRAVKKLLTQSGVKRPLTVPCLPQLQSDWKVPTVSSELLPAIPTEVTSERLPTTATTSFHGAPQRASSRTDAVSRGPTLLPTVIHFVRILCPSLGFNAVFASPALSPHPHLSSRITAVPAALPPISPANGRASHGFPPTGAVPSVGAAEGRRPRAAVRLGASTVCEARAIPASRGAADFDHEDVTGCSHGAAAADADGAVLPGYVRTPM